MKRILCLLVLAGLLAGCAPAPEPPTQASTHTATQAPTQKTTQAAGSSTLQGLTEKELPDCRGIAAMGGDLLVVGEDSLSILDGKTLETVRRETVTGLPAPDSGLLHVRPDGVAYFDTQARMLVVLGTNLRESLRMEMPEDMVGSACLSEGWDTVYYCTASAVRALDMKTGISRLVKEQAAPWQGVAGVVLDGTVLHCLEGTSRQDRKSVLLRLETGEMIYEGLPLQDLQKQEDWIYAIVDHGSVEEIVFGIHQDALQNLYTPRVPDSVALLPRWGGALLATGMDAGVGVSLYHLESGRRTAAVVLEGCRAVEGVAANGENGTVWLWSEGKVYRWNPSLTPVTEEKVYTSARSTRENPDSQGLAQMEAAAAELGSRYGVALLLGEAAVSAAPDGYSFETEYIPQAFQKALNRLEVLLSQFPAGFFQKAAEKSQNKQLTLVLVRGIYGSDAVEAKTSAPGTQYWEEGNLYIALQLGEQFVRYFYHELGHVIDTRVLSTSTVYDTWETLNPEGFQYDNTYRLYHSRPDSPWIQAGWFLDSYSMSFAVEDRCCILEHACLPGNEALFASAYLQSKLQRICAGIRQAFSLEEGTAYLWEQYLQ